MQFSLIKEIYIYIIYENETLSFSFFDRLLRKVFLNYISDHLSREKFLNPHKILLFTIFLVF